MMPSRREFIGTLIGGLAAGAAVRSWPFRVFSFPKQIIRPREFVAGMVYVKCATTGRFIPLGDILDVGIKSPELAALSREWADFLHTEPGYSLHIEIDDDGRRWHGLRG